MNYILLRVHRLNEFVAKTAEFLSQAKEFETVLLADETRGGIGSLPGIRKVSITRERIKPLMVEGCENPLWSCGDYGLYLAREDLPGADYYWLTESDVYLNFRSAADFFDRFKTCPADFVTSYLCPSAKGYWHWYDAMEPFAPSVHKCFFPLSRFSGAAIDALRQARYAMATKYIEMRSEGYSGVWPNDESFVASTLANTPLHCIDMHDIIANLYRGQEYNVVPPHSRKYLEQSEVNERLFHPVREGREYKGRLMYALDTAQGDEPLFAYLQEHAEAEMLAECGPEAASEVRARLEALRLASASDKA